MRFKKLITMGMTLCLSAAMLMGGGVNALAASKNYKQKDLKITWLTNIDYKKGNNMWFLTDYPFAGEVMSKCGICLTKVGKKDKDIFKYKYKYAILGYDNKFIIPFIDSDDGTQSKTSTDSDFVTFDNTMYNKKGKVIKKIKGEFDYNGVRDGVAIAHLDNNHIIVVDGKGKTVLDLKNKYDSVWAFYKGLSIVVTKNNKCGIIDKKGKEIIKPKYDDISYFEDDLAIIRNDGKYGYIDKTGKEVIKPQYDDVDFFSKGMARVTLNEKSFLIDKTGEELEWSKEYDDISHNSDGVALAVKGDKKYLVNKSGEVLADLSEYDDIGAYRGFVIDGMIYVKKGDKYGFIDTNGKEVIKLKYNVDENFETDRFRGGLCLVLENGVYKFIDKKGNVVIELDKGVYATAFSEKSGYAIIYKAKDFNKYYDVGLIKNPLKK